MKKEVRKIFYTTVTIDRIKFNIYATSRGIIKIDLNSPIDKNFPNKTKVNPDDPLLFGVVKQLKEYFARERKIFDVPLDISGTSFQLSVWNQLMSIPYGNLSSYKMVAYEIGGESYIGFKIVLFFFEIATLFLLFLILRELKIEIKYILVYALSPLALSQFMIDAHLDALGFPLILLFVYFYLKQKEALSGIVLGISISIKIVSVILVPLLLKNFFKFRYYWLVIIPIFTFALTYIPFISPSVFPFEALTKFAEHWYFNGVVFTIFYELTINNQTARIICLILFVGIYTLIFFSKKSFIEKTYLIFFSFFILAPTVHPWYLGWFAILLPFHFRWSGVVWTASVSLAFYAIFNSKTFGEWHLPNIFLLIQYLPVGILFIYEMFFSRKQKVIL